MIRSLSAPAHTTIDRATLVLFSAGGTLVGVAVESVERVLRAGAERPLAKPHAHVNAVVEHAGRLVPVLAVLHRLAEDDTHIVHTSDVHGRTLVLARGATWFAVQVDAVHEVVSVDATDIQRCAVVRGVKAVPHVLGELRMGERLVRVLDVSRLLTVAEWQSVAALHSTAA